MNELKRLTALLDLAEPPSSLPPVLALLALSDQLLARAEAGNAWCWLLHECVDALIAAGRRDDNGEDSTAARRRAGLLLQEFEEAAQRHLSRGHTLT